jgi:hypothetical protein
MIGDQRNRALAAEIDIGLVDHHRGVGMISEQLGDVRARQRDAGRRVFVAWLWCPSTNIRTRNRRRLRNLRDRPQWDLTSDRSRSAGWGAQRAPVSKIGGRRNQRGRSGKTEKD